MKYAMKYDEFETELSDILIGGPYDSFDLLYGQVEELLYRLKSKKQVLEFLNRFYEDSSKEERFDDELDSLAYMMHLTFVITDTGVKFK